MASEPTTLREAIVYFSDPDNCRNLDVYKRQVVPRSAVTPAIMAQMLAADRKSVV